MRNLIKEQDDIGKIYLYAKDLIKPKYEFLIKKREGVGTEHLNDSNPFIECSNTMDDVYENVDDYNLQPNERKKNPNCVWWRYCRYYEKKKNSSHNQITIY